MKTYLIFLNIICLICGCSRPNTKNINSQKEHSSLDGIKTDTNQYNKEYFSNYNYYKLSKQSNLSILMLNIKNDSIIEIVSDDDRIIKPISVKENISSNLQIIKDSVFYNNSQIIFNTVSSVSKKIPLDSLSVKNAIIVDDNINVLRNLHIGMSKEKFITEIFNKKDLSLMKYNLFDIYYVIDDDYPNVLFAFENDSLKKILIGNVSY